MSEKYVIGLDYGTLSGRGVLVRVSDGEILNSFVCNYPHAVMDETLCETGEKLPENWALQVPHDYVEVLDSVVPRLMAESGVDKCDVIAIGVDFTSCTMLPVDENNVPLCELDEYKTCKYAYAKLWKHHGAQPEADVINALLEARGLEEDPRFGGKVSSELMVPKAMETLLDAPEIYEAADEFVEAGDWLTRVLTDSNDRSCSMAGYKMWWNALEGYPDADFFKALDPRLENFTSEKLPGKLRGMGERIGVLSKAWADRLCLAEGIAVAPAIIDSHAGFPGSGVSRPDQMMMVLGTSSVMLALTDQPYSRYGVMGGVRDAIVPGWYALESGLACVGDLFGWYMENMLPASYEKQAQAEGKDVFTFLNEKAAARKVGEGGVLALDWFSGNKTPFVDGSLSGALVGMNMTTRPEDIYRAMIEATAFGTKRIVDLYEAHGANIAEVIASGGIAIKNPFVMQIYADVLGKDISVTACDQAAALGSAIYATLAAGSANGGYDDYTEAVQKMSQPMLTTYHPVEENTARYAKLYKLYCALGGKMGDDADEIMHELRKICD